MKINITKKEYEKLLDIFYIADWIMHAFYCDVRPETKEYRELEQRIFAYAKDYGLDDLIEEDIDGGFSPTRKFEDESGAHDFIEEYEEETLWDELIERLARRDFIEKHGLEAMETVFNNEKMFNELECIKEKYSQEFEASGVQKLRIVE